MTRFSHAAMLFSASVCAMPAEHNRRALGADLNFTAGAAMTQTSAHPPFHQPGWLSTGTRGAVGRDTDLRAGQAPRRCGAATAHLTVNRCFTP